MEREMRKFWTVPDGQTKAIEVDCFATQYPEALWVPDLGYTLWHKRHLFDSAAEATSAALTDAQRAHAQSVARVEALTFNLRQLTGEKP